MIGAAGAVTVSSGANPLTTTAISPGGITFTAPFVAGVQNASSATISANGVISNNPAFNTVGGPSGQGAISFLQQNMPGWLHYSVSQALVGNIITCPTIISGTRARIQHMYTNWGITTVTMQVESSTATFPVTLSDRRLKSSIDAPTDALAAINKLAVHSCDIALLNDSGSEHWDCALIADEVKEVIPRAYMPAPENGYENINQLPIVATLVRAVQQLTAKLHALEGAN